MSSCGRSKFCDCYLGPDPYVTPLCWLRAPACPPRKTSGAAAREGGKGEAREQLGVTATGPSAEDAIQITIKGTCFKKLFNAVLTLNWVASFARKIKKLLQKRRQHIQTAQQIQISIKTKAGIKAG